MIESMGYSREQAKGTFVAYLVSIFAYMYSIHICISMIESKGYSREQAKGA
jgi:hypothetical protein